MEQSIKEIIKVIFQSDNLQESMDPESGADLDHRTLPTSQVSNHTHDTQAGDIGAVLHRNKGCAEQKQDIKHLGITN